MEGIEQVRSRAAEVLKAASRTQREAQRALDDCAGELSRVVLAAVEGLEALADAVSALQGELPAPVQGALEASARAAWERLEASGIRLDGRIGEAVDLARHRVVKTLAGHEPGKVASVVTPGVTFQGRRIRDAVVCVGERGTEGR